MKSDKKKLITYVKELFVVVLGISIAFAVDKYAEIKKQDREELLYLQALKSDLENDIEQIQSVLDSSNKILGLTGELFGFIYSNAPAQRFSRQHVTCTYSTPYFSPNNGTYLSLINSGDLKILSDFKLRQEIVAFYTIEYDKIQKSDEFVRELTTNRIYPYILDEITFHPSEDRIMSAEPLKRNKAINLMGSYFNIMNARNQEYKIMLEHCTRLDSLITSSL